MTAVQGKQIEDIVVIGAGIIGIAIAYYLQSEGRSVLLIDRKGVAQETSFGNAGAFAFSDILPLASPGILAKAPKWLLDPLGPLTIPPAYLPKIAPWLFRFWLASRKKRVRQNTIAQASLMRLAEKEMAAMTVQAGLAPYVRHDGSLELYETRSEFEAALTGWAMRDETGIAYQHVRGDGLAELQPGLAPIFYGGTFVPGWQTVSNPFDFASALFDKARDKGVKLQIDEVVALKPDGDAIMIATRGGGPMRSRKTVIACGAWSRPLAQMLGDKVPLETERGYNTTLPPDAFPLKRQLIFGGHGFVITPLSNGIRVGGAVELAGLNRKPNFNRSKAMLAKAARFLPELKAEGGIEWMGFRPSLPDSLPIIGASRLSRHAIYAFGHGHLGLTQSAGTARLVADLVLERPSRLPLYPFRPNRF